MVRMIALMLVSAAAQRVVLEPDASALGETARWKDTGRCQADDIVNLMVMMQHSPQQLSTLEKTLLAVSDPRSSAYGQHMTQSEVTALMAPPKANINAVLDWINEVGPQNVSIGVHQDIISVDLSARKAELLLQTEFHQYQHITTKISITRAIHHYSVPESVAPFIKIVGNVLSFPAITVPKVVSDSDASAVSPNEPPLGQFPDDCGLFCIDKVSPGVLSQRYGLPPAPTAANVSNSSLAVAEFQGQVWDQDDLDRYQSKCKLPNKVTVDHEAGRVTKGGVCKIPIIGTEACGESLLDIEMAKAVGGDIPLTDVYAALYSLLTWAKTVEDMSDEDIPLVHSVSYGNDERQQTSVAYMQSCNTEFMKLGVRGVSILFASGDQGVCGRSGCADEKYDPDFPAASPYITAVGGTDFAKRNVIGDETTWTDGGGGFSDTFAAGEWQASAIAKYKETAGSSLPPQNKWNATGRGYPDVSALAGLKNPYCISAGSGMIGIGGTSAASPVVAAIFARLNALRLAAGKKPMGWLNPWIYQNPQAFHDVVLGKNGEFKDGFPAVVGWDPATGMGTPNYPAMVAAL